MKNTQKKQILCPYCKSKSYPLFKGKDYNRNVSTVIFNVYKCEQCDLRFIQNPPKNLDPYYTEDYHYIPQSAEELEVHLPSQQFKMDILEKFKSSGSLLEIGSSIGQFCVLAKKNNFKVTSIEMNEDCVDFLNKKLKIKAIQSSDPANAMRNDKTKYDAICLWHSIEHMTKPFEVLETCIHHLNEGGVLLVAAPNPLSWQATFMGRFWPHHDLPRHLFAFPVEWFCVFAKKHKLKLKLVTTKDEGSIYWNKFSWGMILRNLCFIKKGKSFAFRIGIIIGSILNKLFHREGKGDCYIIMQK